MRRTLCLLAALLALPLLGSDAPKGYDGALAEDRIEGEWLRVSQEVDGKEAGLLLEEKLTFFAGGRFLREMGLHPMTGDYTIDTRSVPPQLDQVVTEGEKKGRTQKSICRLSADTLKIASTPDGTRPGSFREKNAVVTTYRRVK